MAIRKKANANDDDIELTEDQLDLGESLSDEDDDGSDDDDVDDIDDINLLEDEDDDM